MGARREDLEQMTPHPHASITFTLHTWACMCVYTPQFWVCRIRNVPCEENGEGQRSNLIPFPCPSARHPTEEEFRVKLDSAFSPPSQPSSSPFFLLSSLQHHATVTLIPSTHLPPSSSHPPFSRYKHLQHRSLVLFFLQPFLPPSFRHLEQSRT